MSLLPLTLGFLFCRIGRSSQFKTAQALSYRCKARASPNLCPPGAERGPFQGRYPRQWAQVFGFLCRKTCSHVLKEKLRGSFSLDGPRGCGWSSIYCPLATSRPWGEKNNIFTHAPPPPTHLPHCGSPSLASSKLVRRGSAVPEGAEEGSRCQARHSGALLHQAVPRRGPGGSGLCEALWGISTLLGVA